MRSFYFAATALVALGAPTLAQNDLGLRTGTGSVTVVSRVFRDAPEEILSRIDSDDYVGIGVDAANPGTINITGSVAVLADFDLSTQQDFFFTVRTQGAPNSPDVTNPPLTRVGPVNFAIGTGGAGAVFRVNFGTPVSAPAGQDVFVGVEVPAEVAPPPSNDLLWVYSLSGTGGSVFDIGGPAIDTSSAFTDTYRHTFRLSPAGSFITSRGLWLIDPIVAGPGGVCTAITNQASLASSNAAPGVASPMSGLHPDVNDFNTTGRADEPGFLFRDAAYANQNVIFILSGLGLAASPTALGSLIPGSSGSYCFNDPAGGAFVAGVVANNDGVASINVPLDAAARASLGGSGLDLQWAAIATDGVTFSGSPCGQQTF